VVDHFDGDISRANLHPRTTAKYVAKYGSGSVKEAA
jgi:hypothetical protein